jgi:hypothetical protein
MGCSFQNVMPLSPRSSLRRSILALALLTGVAAAQDALEPIVVTGKAENLLGEAQAASQGQSSREELLERPWLRRGELLETVPGLIVTQHSGDGKANQYFVRGYNLDHGTDFGTFVDGMPANYRAHAHGQGYTDLNFIIPEFVERLDYQKGPFAAHRGDLSTAGSAEFILVDELPRGFAGITMGEDNYWRGVFGDSVALGGGVLTYGGEASWYEGPWVLPEDVHRFNGLLRWHKGDEDNYFNVTLMGSQGEWRATDQIPLRAVQAGQLDRFGFIDPSNGGQSQRYSLSTNFGMRDGNFVVRGKAYAGYYDLDLFSNFTYFLDDPVNGDQFRQSDARAFAGADIAVDFENRSLFGAETTYTLGFQTHNDWISDLGLARTRFRNEVTPVREDDVFTGSYSLYVQAKTKWNDWFRTEAAVRGDLFAFDVDSDLAANSGSDLDGMVVPKLNLIFGPWHDHELYLNLGGGFHSNDARGVTLKIDPNTGTPAAAVDPLVRTWGTELGVRSQWSDCLTTTVALWALFNDSELLYVGDAGNVDAGPPTTRYGVEFAAYYRVADWFSFDGEVSLAEGRYNDIWATGGPWIENQVPVVVSSGFTLGEERGLFGAMRARYFSERPLTATKGVQSSDSFQVNARVGYRWESCEVALDCLNLLDRADNDIEYYYASRLPGEGAAGVEDIHFHPAEPRTLRASVTWYW